MIRRRVSELSGSFLVRGYLRAMARGRTWSLPYRLWALFPRGVNKWVRHRVMTGVEAHARERLASHDPLRELNLGDLPESAISYSSILILWNLLESKKPNRVLELGSGVSTAVFALFAKVRGRSNPGLPPVCSLEHNREWLEMTRNQLRAYGLEEYVRLIHAPLVERDILGKTRRSYDLSEWPEGAGGSERFELCLIDGPPGTVGRSGTLPTVAPLLADGAVVLLDDVYRPGEREAWEEWRAKCGSALTRQRTALTEHGMAVAIWRRPRDGGRVVHEACVV